LKAAGLTVAALGGFQYLNFYLPTTLQAGNTMLMVTGTASTVNVGIAGSSSLLGVGDTVTLIHAAGTLDATGINAAANGAGLQGVTLAYQFALAADATDLAATVTGIGISEGAKALSEGYLAGMAGLDRGSDLVSGAGMANAVAAADAGRSAFVAVSGSSVRSETGSHVDLDQGGLMAGVVQRVDLSAGRLTAGAFAEFGGGSYDTGNATSSGLVRGSGDVHNLGGGLVGHMDFRPLGHGHVYAEAATRVGMAYNSFDSNDLTSLSGIAARYDASSAYYGVSAAIGYVWNLNATASLDVYGKYFQTRLNGDSVRLSTGETVDFDDIDSQRTRVGARLSYALADHVTPYVGMAWEHEFDGESRATTNGYSLAAPTLQGDTGIAEIGLTMTPSATMPLQVDIGLQGFLGRNQGVAGNLRATLAF
jgi:outer membrane autotransporter protein